MQNVIIKLSLVTAQWLWLAEAAQVAVIGSGYSGLSAALELRRLGHEVDVYEKSSHVGGRGYQWEDSGFKFDAGPSWYWMPSIFERIFEAHGRKVSDFYNLTRLEPAYRIIFEDEVMDVPGKFENLVSKMADIEPESEGSIRAFFEDGKTKFNKGIGEWIWKPLVSLSELFDFQLIKAGVELNMFGGFEAHVNQYVHNTRLRTLLKWPVIFLGASPAEAPAMYSLMTYAGHAQGTWYPEGGLSTPANAMAKLATEIGVKFHYNAEISTFRFEEGRVSKVCTGDQCDAVDAVVAAADYHWVEQNILPPEYRNYNEQYWDRQALSPSCLLYYLGVRGSLKMQHHTFFFDEDLDAHLKTVFEDHGMSDHPTFYVTDTTVTDPSTAPEGSTSLFVLVPISYRLNGTDTKEVRAKVLDHVISRMEKHLGPVIQNSIVYQRSYGPSDFEKEFHSFRGNAFGHANILQQSLLFKPSMESKVRNMVYAGHLTNPGPGVPPALASGATAARLLDQKLMQSSFDWIPVIALVLIACLLWRRPWSSGLSRSYQICTQLLHKHGRTYFAASTLMDKQRFLDIAGLYGLFRVADDYVDTLEPAHVRRENLENFISKFWRNWEAGVGSWEDHPVLPAVIETTRRLNFPKEFFEEFFYSMRMDANTPVICRTLDDTILYMRGSAAVIGDFMVPLLMPNATEEERARARPHARDLGNAFQLTNFIRDIDEDQDLDRQYIPEEICQQFGVKLSLRDNDQPRLPELIEHMFSLTDKYYESADIGIEMLPEGSQEVCRAARLMYHEIHEMIRKRQYHIHSGRAKVPFLKKLKIFSSVTTKSQICRMVFQELRARMIAKVDQMIVPVALLFCMWQLTGMLNMPQATYAQFHLMFTIPQTLLAWYLAKRWAPTVKYFRQGCAWTLVMCVVATVYTTPWDNYLVASGVWGYGDNKDGRVLGTLGWVPIEEYLFFSLETAMVGGVWLCTQVVEEPPIRYTPKPWRRLGLSMFTIMFIAGCALLQTATGFYMGLILVWAMPVLALQWAFGADALMAQRKVWQGPLISVWIYLCLVDRWAIRNGIWSLNPDLTLPLIDVLPIEEAFFFLISATMCLWGLVLAMSVTTLDGPFPQSLWKVMCWSNKSHMQSKTTLLVALATEMQPKSTSLVAWATENHRSLLLSFAALVSIMAMSSMSVPLQIMCLGLTCVLFGLLSLFQVAIDQLKRPTFRLTEQFIISSLMMYQWNTCARIVLPSLAFKIFACMMIYRFGKADTAQDPTSRLPVIDVFARGGLLLLALRWHPSAFADYFTYLFGGQYDSLFSSMSFLQVLGSIHLIALMLSLVYHALKCHEGRHLAILHEICTLLLVLWFVPPAISIVLWMAVFDFSRNLEWLSQFALTKRSEELKQPQNLWQKLSISMALSCLLAMFFLHDAVNSSQTGYKIQLANFSFIWLSSTTMLHIAYRTSYRSWISEKFSAH